ncbi:MAG: class I SAM-dependent methyltransferase [Geobacteraceae bacterium]|nr:class I SAM-dependent methyltransferase [Geobacteraceae bacterium]
MLEDQVSRTALFTAYSRGYHCNYDKPRIFADPLAFSLLSSEERDRIELLLMEVFRAANPVAAALFTDTQSAMGWMMQSGAAASILLSRAQYAEECLEKSLESGVCQYVMLGAGLDSFAFRRPELAEKLELFEIDHPATQAHKRQRLTELGWVQPANLHYVPVDFTRQRLADRLGDSPYDPGLPVFFSWLGVTYYLPREVVLATLREVAKVAKSGSSIVFDYLDREAFEPRKCAPRVQRMLNHVESLGEPMQSGFDPLSLPAEMTSVGLELAENLCPGEIHSRWFLGRSDHYRACEHVHFAHAKIL